MDLERRIAYGLVNLVANAEAQDAVEITVLRMIPRDGGWLLMLKGTRKGRRLVAFTWAETFGAALRICATQVDSGHVDWRVEKPPAWKA